MEIKILDLIQNLRTPWLDAFFTTFTKFGNHGEIWIAILIVLLCTKKYRKIAIFAAIAILCEVVMVEGILKNVFQRPRPFLVNEAIELMIPIPSGFSFPSGHTASSFAVAFVLWFNKVPFKKTIMTLATLMGLSRLYVYVHYPTDVLAGALLGLAIAWIVYQIQIKYYSKKITGGNI